MKVKRFVDTKGCLYFVLPQEGNIYRSSYRPEIAKFLDLTIAQLKERCIEIVAESSWKQSYDKKYTDLGTIDIPDE